MTRTLLTLDIMLSNLSFPTAKQEHYGVRRNCLLWAYGTLPQVSNVSKHNTAISNLFT
jgi:hypothetical protein